MGVGSELLGNIQQMSYIPLTVQHLLFRLMLLVWGM